MKISVALAAYKGEKFIGEQLESILPQLNEDDEIIVSDDYPCNSMREIIGSFNDNRIKYIDGPGKGVIKNFENAIKESSGDIIFLCDQDDVWLPDKVEKCKEALSGDAVLVLHDAEIVDGELNKIGESFFAEHGTKVGFLNNLLKNSYMGCCMAFKRELVKYILPFPESLPMHDQWIGLNAEKYGKVRLLEEKLIKYRRHGNNVTGGKTGFKQKIVWRIQIARAILRK